MAGDIESYENNLELELFREYRDVIGLFKYVVETERRFYLCNHVDVQARPVGGGIFFLFYPTGRTLAAAFEE